MQEDHVSMGWSAARKLRRALDGLTRVLAIELLTAARGIELRRPLQPAPASAAVIAALRAAGAPAPGSDRWLAPEIDTAVDLMGAGAVVTAAESVVGRLN
jgi:histidine ammonia-lyase